jgi:Uma2 family endonuclease
VSTLTRTPYRWKTSDLERLPDEPLLRYEIIDGELIVSRRPDWKHQNTISKVIVITAASVNAIGGVVLPEPGIEWGDDAEDNVSPDVAIILKDRMNVLTGPKLSGAPNIAMEVVSAGSVETDYFRKRDLYRRTGVQQYWIIDRLRHTVEVWRFADGKATSESYENADVIQTPLVPSLSVHVSELW